MTTHLEIEDPRQIAREAKEEAERTGEPVHKVISRHLKKYYKRKVAAQQ